MSVSYNKFWNNDKNISKNKKNTNTMVKFKNKDIHTTYKKNDEILFSGYCGDC